MRGTLKLKVWLENNIANFITFLRYIFSFCIIVIGIWYWHLVLLMFILVTLAALSDLLDGWIARRYNKVSEFGGFLDRLADKIYFCPLIVIIIWRYWPVDDIHPLVKIFTETMGGVIILLEFILIMSSWVGILLGKSISANQWGKWKMASESCAVILWFLFLVLHRYYEFDMRISIVIVDLCLLAAIICADKSIRGYYQRFMEINK